MYRTSTDVSNSLAYSVCTCAPQILKGVSLRVAPGESVAVVGSSGSGKSTILKMVTRLYDVWPGAEGPGQRAGAGQAEGAEKQEAEEQGANGTGARTGGSGVYVNGVDVRHLQLDELRSAIAVVPQVGPAGVVGSVGTERRRWGVLGGTR